MASSTTVSLDTRHRPVFAVPDLSRESAEKTSKLLQENHEKHHVFFNKDGFHNHIVHHLLSIYALGAPPDIIQAGYDENAAYQRPPVALEHKVVSDLRYPEKFKQYLGDEKYYHDFLVFFQKEIDAKGWQEVLNEYLFEGNEQANDLFARMYAGFLHPIIHLGFGIEFEQPAVIAEALAQAAIHNDWMNSFLFDAEKAAKQNGDESLNLIQIMEKMLADDKLRNSPHWSDGNKIRDGIIARAGDEMIKYAGLYKASPETLQKKTAEMINFTIYYATAAQHPPNVPKIDFFFMHDVNCSIFHSSFLDASWLSPASKVRLLEYKARVDLAMYISRASPKLLLDEITKYEPRQPSKDMNSLFERIVRHMDDGHASKLVRAIANGQQVCKMYEDEDGFMIKGDMWLKLGHLVTDSVDAGGERWVRSCGFEEAWKDIPLREGAKL